MRLAPALLLSLLLTPSAARAVEAAFGAMSETGYNSNVFYQSNNPTGGGNARFGPVFELRDRTGQFTWKLGYEPSYQAFYNVSGVNSFYQLANGDLSWKPSDATEFFLNDTFSDTPIFSSTFQTNQQGLLAQPVPVFTNSDVIQNYANGGVRHAFGPRWLGELSFSSSILNYQNSAFFDSTGNTGQVYVTYGLSGTDRIGSGLSATRQTFSRPGTSSGGSNYYQLFGIWSHEFSPTWSFNLNVGPTLVQPDTTTFENSRTAPIYSRQLGPNNGNILSPLVGGTNAANANIQNCVPYQDVLVAEGCQVLTTPGGPLPANQVVAFDPTTMARLDLTQLGTLNELGGTPSSGGTSLTYFANVSMTKRWSWFEVTGTYVRNASNTSGYGQSLVTDTFTITPVFRPSPLWTITLSGIFIRRESAAQQAFNLTPVQLQSVSACLQPDNVAAFTNAGLLVSCNLLPSGTPLQLAQAQGLRAFTSNSSFQLVNYGFTAQVNRQLTRNAYVYGRASYEYQTSKRSGFSSVNVDRYIVTVGVRYEFEPFHFLN